MFVTTSAAPSSKIVCRARAVAERCGVPFARRRGALPPMLDAHGSTTAYIVRRDREELRSRSAGLFVHAGMLPLKRRNGRQHPLVRAVELRGRAPSVFDATVGLAGDALHLACVLGRTVQGTEASPVVFSLLENGLTRLASCGDTTAEAAARVEVRLGDATVALAAMPAGCVDVVIVDPMFDSPRPAAPGFELLRAVAFSARDVALLLDAARRAAASHVVVKYPKRATYPSCDACVDGKAVRYLVYDALGPAPATGR